MSSSEQKRLTTAETFGKLRTELIENGIPEDIADSIVRESAIKEIAEYGIAVRA